MDLEIIATFIFFLAIGIYLVKRRKGLEFHYGIIIKRWKKGIEKIDKLVKGKKKILRKVGNIFVAIGILISLSGVYFLARYTLQLKQVFGLALPSVAGIKYPGPVISIPFWYWIIAIFTVIASHETMHAIFSRVEKVKLKNYGIIFFLLFPIGAFVDPEKREFEKLKGMKKMRVYAAGSFGNFLVFAIVLLLVFLSTKIADSLIESVGLKFEVLPNTPAEKVGLEGIMLKINNQTIKSKQDLINFLNKAKPGENITILTTKGEFSLSLAQHPEEKNRGFIGINNTIEVYVFKTIFSGHVPESLINLLAFWYGLLFWLAILNLGVAIANLLPAKPLDGGYLFEEIFRNFFGKNGEKMANVLSAIIFFLLFFNIFAVNLIRAI